MSTNWPQKSLPLSFLAFSSYFKHFWKFDLVTSDWPRDLLFVCPPGDLVYTQNIKPVPQTVSEIYLISKSTELHVKWMGKILKKKPSLKNHITLSKIEISTNGSNLAHGNAFRTASYHSISNSLTHLREKVSRWRGPSSVRTTPTPTTTTTWWRQYTHPSCGWWA